MNAETHTDGPWEGENRVDWLREMLRIRRFEEKCVELYSGGLIRGFLHLYIGEEAVAVGAAACLGPEDAVVGTYREHGYALARGVPSGVVMAEMFGKREGCARGRGGSMHLFDAKTRLYGGNAIVAGGLPLAVGLALADQMQNRARVTCCVFGEGAMAEGDFHEAMNLAALWKVPVLFVCENNLYAMGTPVALELAGTDLARKAEAYNVPAASVDGMDVEAVAAAVRAAVAGVRAGAGPFFIECRTYRFRAHSMFDAELYRDKAEVALWKKRDPIPLFRERLQSEGLLTETSWGEMEARVAEEIREAVKFAEAGTPEPVSELSRYVYSEAGP